MGSTISIEQLDGTLEDLRREAQKLEARIAAMKDLRALFFGTDATGGGADFGAGPSAAGEGGPAEACEAGEASGHQGHAAAEHLRRLQADLAAEQDDPEARVPALWIRQLARVA